MSLRLSRPGQHRAIQLCSRYCWPPCWSLRGSVHGVVLDVQVENTSLNLESAIACGLIINEIFSNALRHAFPPEAQASGHAAEPGKISIGFHRRAKSTYCLEVADNGLGLPADVSLAHSRSFGLRLVRILTQQLGGSIELDRSNGTAFSIIFFRVV